MEKPMTVLIHRRLTGSLLNELIDSSPLGRVSLTDDHRQSLASRFRAVAGTEHRRLDSWMVERAGQLAGTFQWSPITARRVLGNAALRRVVSQPSRPLTVAVHDEMTDQLLRAATGYARSGTLAHWLASVAQPVLGIVSAEAVNWATQADEVVRGLDQAWRFASNDAYYDVAAARTTLRGRRDVIIDREDSRVVIRIRGGAPNKTAGPGLRSDLVIETLAHPDGVAPSRFIGLWPEAGVCLAVDGQMPDLRAGARDLVRTAVVQRRRRTLTAA